MSELKQLEMQARKETAIRVVERLKHEQHLATERFAKHVGESVSAGAYLSDRFCSTQISDAIAESEHTADEAEQAYQQASEARRRLAIEVETLEKLRIEHWQAYRKKTLRKTMDLLDETVLRQQTESQETSRR